jgi:hypothetical protein
VNPNECDGATVLRAAAQQCSVLAHPQVRVHVIIAHASKPVRKIISFDDKKTVVELITYILTKCASGVAWRGARESSTAVWPDVAVCAAGTRRSSLWTCGRRPTALSYQVRRRLPDAGSAQAAPRGGLWLRARHQAWLGWDALLGSTSR